MEYSPTSTTHRVNGQQEDEQSKMSMIAMAQPVPHSAFKREFAWDESSQSDHVCSSRPRSGLEKVSLPSIREVRLDINPTQLNA